VRPWLGLALAACAPGIASLDREPPSDSATPSVPPPTGHTGPPLTRRGAEWPHVAPP